MSFVAIPAGVRALRTTWLAPALCTRSYAIRCFVSSAITSLHHHHHPDITPTTLLSCSSRTSSCIARLPRRRHFATRAELAARAAATKSPEAFIQTVSQLFARIERACADGGLVEKNPGFTITRNTEGTSLTIQAGTAAAAACLPITNTTTRKTTEKQAEPSNSKGGEGRGKSSSAAIEKEVLTTMPWFGTSSATSTTATEVKWVLEIVPPPPPPPSSSSSSTPAQPIPRLCMTSTKIAGSQGVLYYVYDTLKGEWISESDKHFLVELLTRDLIHICKGYPVF